jgi:hypothetical protein
MHTSCTLETITATSSMTVHRALFLVAVLFAWGFVMHGVGLLLHEMGGHALAATVLACGIDGYDLTLFGHGQVHYPPCSRWSWERVLVVEWAGLLLTIAAGLAATVAHRRGGFPGPTRLLLALVGFFFLVGQLGYATTGGFYDLYDPGRTAQWLGARGLHVLAWLPPLFAYAASALVNARAIVLAFRDLTGARTRRQLTGWLTLTLGAAGTLYYAAFAIEARVRADIAMRGVATEARRIASNRGAPDPFPMDLLLVLVAAAAFATALARTPDASRATEPPSRRFALSLVAATVGCLGVLVGLIRG